MVFKKWVKHIQTAGYDGACTVYIYLFSDLSGYHIRSENHQWLTCKGYDAVGSLSVVPIQSLYIGNLRHTSGKLKVSV